MNKIEKTVRAIFVGFYLMVGLMIIIEHLNNGFNTLYFNIGANNRTNNINSNNIQN